MRDLYPFESHYLDLDGLKYHYVDEGSGSPLLMIHGNPTWSFYFRNLILALKDKYRVIAPDHIGCGLSDKPDEKKYDYTLSRRVKDLEALIDSLGIKDNLTLIVHDWGGMIGMAYAVKHPEKIKRIVVMNTSGFHLPKTKKFPWPLHICRNTPLGSFLVRALNMFCLVAATECCKRKPLSKKVKDAYLYPYNSWENRVAIYNFVKDIPLKHGDRSYDIVSNVEENLEQFKNIPMLICWGEKDFVFDIHFLNEWKRRFPEAEVHSFSDAGHYILEDAESEVIDIIKKFFEKDPIEG